MPLKRWAVKVPADKSSTLDYKHTERLPRIATAMMILGFFLLFGGVIARGISAGRVPWGNMYEFSITGALAFSGAYLLALRKFDLRWWDFWFQSSCNNRYSNHQSYTSSPPSFLHLSLNGL